MQSTILVTGGAGYIGSHIAYLLARNDYHVICLDTFNHQQHFSPSWATIIHGDCADKTLLHSLFKTYNVTAVIHCAAYIEVSESLHHPLNFYHNNVAKTISLLEIMIDHQIKNFIFSSSCAVYGNPVYTPLDEHHNTQPISPYGSTKLMIESILHDCSKAYDISYIALRYFNAAGALAEENLGEQHQPETHILPRLLHAALESLPFTAYGQDFQTRDGSAIRDFIHVLDIAQAHLCAVKHLERENPSDIFNLGTGRGNTVKEMISTVEKICRTSLKVMWEKPRPGDPAILVADAQKAHNILNWEPRLSDIAFIVQSALSFERVRHSLGHKQHIVQPSGI